MINRRRQPRPTTRIGFLEQLPALVLLDRMPTPVIAVGREDGALLYANPASAALLGYPDSSALTAQTLPALMAEHADTTDRGCVAALITAAVVYLNHSDGYEVSIIASEPFLCRTDDPVLLVALTDTTELKWNTGPAQNRPPRWPDETAPPALTA